MTTTEGVSQKNPPYFYMNGHNFKIDTDAETESDINLVENRMFVPAEYWGYTDIQWTNFAGEKLPIKVYSRNDTVYRGEAVPPVGTSKTDSNVKKMYSNNPSEFAILKYWAQTFVPITLVTNIPAFENGTYVIRSFKQSAPEYNFIVTAMELIQYEKPDETVQTYWRAWGNSTKTDSSKLTAAAKELEKINCPVKQSCVCDENTDYKKCKASVSDSVKLIQRYLQRWGYFLVYSRQTGRVPVTGKFCWYTTQAISNFQRDNGLTIDGVFNTETRKAFIDKL